MVRSALLGGKTWHEFWNKKGITKLIPHVSTIVFLFLDIKKAQGGEVGPERWLKG